jgi:GTP:adenosylcobinamide-phosphate guanylyltransferase
MTATPKILVLAGRRSATLDPLAEKFGVSHKCLVPVRGVPMIVRVLDIVDEAFPDAKIFVSIENFGLIRELPVVVRLMAEGRLTPVDAQSHIVDSIVHAAKTTAFPLIVTTADNVLMTPDALRRLAEAGPSEQADALVVMARKEAIQATHIEGQNRFYEFRDGGFSNCNMFWLGNARALHATEAFRHGGQFAKKPERILKTFGILNLIRFRFRLNTLPGIFRHISRRFRVDVRPLVLEEGRLAIDVDNERTHRVAEEVLGRETNA